jgi:hypothetical protein
MVMELGSRLVTLLLNLLDLDLPLTRLRRWGVISLMALVLLFPGTLRAGLLHFGEERACSLDQTLSHDLKLTDGRFQVIDANGWCELHFDRAGG